MMLSGAVLSQEAGHNRGGDAVRRDGHCAEAGGKRTWEDSSTPSMLSVFIVLARTVRTTVRTWADAFGGVGVGVDTQRMSLWPT